MKKTIKKTAYVACAACSILAASFVLQGCNSDEEVTSTSVEVKESSFAKDLKKVADAERKLLQNIFSHSLATRSGDTPSDSIYTGGDTDPGDFEDALSDLFENNDITSDLTAEEIEAMNLDAETREVLSLDEEAFQAYIHANKSEAFCNIYQQMMDGKDYIASYNEIANNDDLKMNEKVSLTILLIIKDVVPFAPDQPEDEPGNKTVAEKIKECGENYDSDMTDCYVQAGRDGVLIVLGVICGGPESIGISAPAAVFNYIYCTNKAAKNYRKCVERAVK